MGAHFALYAATELHTKFAGLILHNTASCPKKKVKMTEEENKHLNTYIPTANLQRAERIFIPTLIIHTAFPDKLDVSHSERLAEKIPSQFLAKGTPFIFPPNTISYFRML